MEKKTYKFGNAAYAHKGTHTLYEPIKRGLIRDKIDQDNMELIWTHIFDELSLEPKNCNVLMTHSPFAEKIDRQWINDHV